MSSNKLIVAHAFTPQERGNYGGSDHAVVTSDLSIGRLHRKAGDALCKPACKFWGLVESNRSIDKDPVTCKRCIEIATKLILINIAQF